MDEAKSVGPDFAIFQLSRVNTKRKEREKERKKAYFAFRGGINDNSCQIVDRLVGKNDGTLHCGMKLWE